MTTWNRDDSDLSTSTGLASTTVGNIRITGSTVGHISDTDILTFAENTLDITAANVDINGTLTIKNAAGDTTYYTLSNSGISSTLPFSSGDVTIGTDTDGTDRKIILGHQTAKTIIGIDDSQDCFAINIGSDFTTLNSLEVNSSGTVIAGTLIVTSTIASVDNITSAANISGVDGNFSGDLSSVDLTTTGDIYLADTKKIYIGTSSDNDYIRASGDAIQFYTNNSNRFSVTDSHIQHFVPSIYHDDGAILQDASGHTRLSFTDAGSTVLYDESGNTTLTLDTSQNVTLTGDLTLSAGGVTMSGNLSSANLSLSGYVNSALTVGVNDTGHDVKFFGATSGKYMLWDESADKLIVQGEADFHGDIELSTGDFKANGSTTNTYMLWDESANRLNVTDTTSSANIHLQTISDTGGNAPNIDFYKKSESSSANDVIGILDFRGRNNADDADVRFGKIEVEVIDSSKGAEEGRIKLGVTANGSLVQEGIVLKGTGSGLVDVDIANGGGSTTTIAGDLTISGGNITNAITFDSGITDAGTISAGTWSGTALVAAKVPAHDDLTGFVSNEHIDWTGSSAGTIHATNYTNTTYTGGTNLTLDGTTFNVDDAFLVNNADDTMTGTLTVDKNSTATTGGNVDGIFVDFDHTGICASGQTINNRGIINTVNSDSPTHVGTVNNSGIVNTITGGTSGTQTNYGFYNTVLSADTNIGIRQKVTDGGLDLKFVSSADTADYFSLATTANGATTLKTLDDGGAGANLTFDIDGGVVFDQTTVGELQLKVGSTAYMRLSNDLNAGTIHLYSTADNSDYMYISTGTSGMASIGTTAAPDNTTATLTLAPTGNLVFMPSTNVIDCTDSTVGFTQTTASISASATVAFHNDGNKHKITLTGNITDLTFQFPNKSGNFICVLLQDATGGRTITNWKTKDSAGNAGAGNSGLVLWAGADEPENTETANKADIASFYWDADNEIAYGTYSYNF